MQMKISYFMVQYQFPSNWTKENVTFTISAADVNTGR